ncbi:MAG: DUF1902 domain-containing protein [Oscillospiraceae bacterium]|nr:DUF1902 domain-containing protein [Oscillospiraceae bacterium]
MTEYTIQLTWDDEASAWLAINDEIPIALEDGSLDALMVHVKYVAPEILVENGRFTDSKEIQLRFRAERVERLDCSGFMERNHLPEEVAEMASATEIAVQLARETERLRYELLLKIERGAAIEEIKAHLETGLESCGGMTDYQFKRYMELKDKCAAQEQQLNALKNAPLNTTPNGLRLPALDACVTIDNDIVTVKSNDGKNIQLSLREWEELRKSLRFDDCVDYERGETPMTVYQLQIFINLTREIKGLTKQISQSS